MDDLIPKAASHENLQTRLETLSGATDLTPELRADLDILAKAKNLFTKNAEKQHIDLAKEIIEPIKDIRQNLVEQRNDLNNEYHIDVLLNTPNIEEEEKPSTIGRKLFTKYDNLAAQIDILNTQIDILNTQIGTLNVQRETLGEKYSIPTSPAATDVGNQLINEYNDLENQISILGGVELLEHMVTSYYGDDL